ncbi:hypothetical protein, partial [Mesorhizobium sp. M7A.F.Ca.CA.002.15.2.1]|uniref:hypothetical protein n=1 Tax=Mesorhizobium sp. M7A.F.Ca.CA.002.15.2.1 TaxID=2496678 RepID=UPI0019D1EC0C
MKRFARRLTRRIAAKEEAQAPHTADLPLVGEIGSFTARHTPETRFNIREKLAKTSPVITTLAAVTRPAA